MRAPLPIVLPLLLAAAGAACDRTAEADLVFRGGTLIDGTGTDGRRADVALKDGRVLATGDLARMRAARDVDASGLVVAPGFVDLHSHADLILLGDRETQQRLLRAKISQGVTTVVVGNCGLGVAPSTPEAAAILSAVNGWMTPEGVSAGAMDTGEYLDRVESGGAALNVATLIPHGPVRISAMGLAGGRPSPEQLEAMRAAVARGLDAGAFGLSSGLIYPPGMYSATDELVELAKVVAGSERLFTAHVRGSSETLLEGTDELITIAERSGARVHHSHLEAVGEPYWPRVREVLAREDRARKRGLRISHDVFPYTRAATMMAAVFPPWSLEGGVDALLQRLRDPRTRARIRDDIATRRPEWPPWVEGGWPHNLVGAVGWDGILVASVGPEGPSEWIGRDLATIAAGLGRDPFDVVADLMVAEDGRVGQLVDEISGRDDRREVLLSIARHPSAAIVSDAEDYGRGVPHPAHAGAFARALRLSRESELPPLEETVRRMTSRPAAILGLPRRGVLKEGAPADVVVFDPERVSDTASWDEPRRPAVGVAWVVVNGVPVVQSGNYVGGLPGRVLRAERP